MAEIKNSFLRSKMNKDLDDRLVPSGEYRNAQNISVGQSEADNIGALETILGTTVASTFGLNNVNLEVIGQYSDKTQNRMFVFLTDYEDTSDNMTLPPTTKKCYIYEFIPNTTPGYTLLVSGIFLNFSKGSLITGINIIEELLFWTDNRNQPRKININTAKTTSNYYTEESDISVAKYNPYQPISLLQKITAVTTTAVSSATLAIADTTGIYKGMLAIQYGNSTFGPEDYLYVTAVDGGLAFGTLVGGTGYGTATGLATTGGTGTGLTVDITTVLTAITVVTIATPGDGYTVGDVITIVQGGGAGGSITLTSVEVFLNVAPAIVNAGEVTFLATTMTGQDITLDFNGSEGGASKWPGDPDYLESKFIRFSYRFGFDDGEYSLMAPFTPIAFIPKQKGYFLKDDEDATYQSTIVEFMENGVQNIELLIPFPDTLNKVQATTLGSYKIKSLDILYKESDATIVKVLDSIKYDEINYNTGLDWTAITDTNIYIYNYQSRKPFRSLPPSQITRVYDKVPVKALAQETAGNRVIYGNFKDKYTPPQYFTYQVGVGPKSLSLNFDNWCEYPNHSVKQNRNYQVGFVLGDKFGRQSDVVLSGVQLQSYSAVDGTVYGGSTIYNPYNIDNTSPNIRDWFGDSLKIRILESITSGTTEGTPNNTTNEPGLYANPLGSGFNIAGTTPSVNTAVAIPILAVPGFKYEFTLTGVATNIPSVGSFLRGKFVDYIEVVEKSNVGAVYKIYTYEPINVDSYSLTSPAISPDFKYAYTINPVGWYSYKVVVKQQEQDYYNVYLPGILNGYPNQEPAPLTGTNPFNLPAPPFPQTTFTITDNGNGYSDNTNVATTGGTGTGLTVDITVGTVAPNIGKVTAVLLDASGINYTVGDILTITGGGADAEITLTSVGETGETANIVLINDNINKVPRDLAIVGPDQKQFRSSVQMFGRVENTMTTGTASNIQYFPLISNGASVSDTVVSISTADDADMDYNTLSIARVDGFPAPARAVAGGVMNLYQNGTNPLIGRISTATNIGVISTNFVDTNMIPYLAIYETEPFESLLDIFWETPTVGLIADLNAEILNEYTGAVAWSTYSSALFTEYSPAAGVAFISNIKPLNASGVVLFNTTAVITSIVNNSGGEFPGLFNIVPNGTGADAANPIQYSFNKNVNEFVFNDDQNLRNYTINISVTNNDSLPTSTVSLPISIQLVNETPIINGGVALPLQTRNITDTGAIATITGVNGSAWVSNNQDQLQWSITAAVGSPSDTLDYFTITAVGNDGYIDQIAATPIGEYHLTVRLTDANSATGSLYDEADQQISVSSAVIGNYFNSSLQGGNPTLFCSGSGAPYPSCNSLLLYSQTALVSGYPVVGAEIRTGPNGTSSPLASTGYYSLNCGGPGTREYFYISGSDGKVTTLFTIANGGAC